jgi:hypothetical protein
MADLPQEVLDLQDFSPIEDFMLALLRDKLPSMRVRSLIEDTPSYPFLLVRRDPVFGGWTGDSRFVDSAEIAVHAFCQDPNGDEDAARLSEAVRVLLYAAAREQKVYPGLGHIVSVEMTSAPRRAPDWATATGPVQYADLPTGVWRYETKYRIEIRKPRT